MIDAVGPGKRVIVLDPNEDGIAQVVGILRRGSGLDAVRLLSHGVVGN